MNSRMKIYALEAKLQRIREAIEEQLSWYPTDVFIPNGDSRDAISADAIRHALRVSLNKIQAIIDEGQQ